MSPIKFVIHVGGESGVQDDVSAVDAATFEIEQQFPCKCPPSRRHFGRAGLGRVNSLVIIELPRRRDVLVTDWFPQPVDQIDKVSSGNREAQFPKPRDVYVTLQDGRGQSFREFNL